MIMLSPGLHESEHQNPPYEDIVIFSTSQQSSTSEELVLLCCPLDSRHTYKGVTTL
jgi:hypothetical protein